MRPLPESMVCGRVPVIDALEHWRRTDPERTAITYLAFAGRERRTTTVSYAGLAAAVDAMGSALEERTAPGDRVALLMDQSIDYVVAFLACLRVGRLAVPLFGVDARRPVDRVRRVLADSAPAATVLDRRAERDVVAGALGLDTVYLGPADARDGAVPAGSPVTAHETAYLQYTSGSTRDPAGVMITQDNFAVGASQLRLALGLDPAATVVTWLPYFHDMGLLLGLGATVQAGAHGIHMSPMAFVQQPVRWLQAISDFRATTTVVPNFALDHATTRVPEEARAGLDLSCLRSLGNGSEPVRAGSLQAFTDMYAPHGFTHDVHLPGYGLAETTLVVTSSVREEGLRVVHADRDDLTRGQVRCREEDGSTAALVSTGRPIAQDVRIVDPGTHRVLPDGEVGEVWVQGPNVSPGYLGKEELSATTLHAQSPDLPGRWARTGDLAAFVDGHLYIVGRIKDLVIVGGKNHYPADVEGTVQAWLTATRPNGVAVFAHTVEDAAEVAVMVIELDPKKAKGMDRSVLARTVRSVVAERHELALHDIVLAGPGAIPKTSSGKIQRRACATRYAQGLIAQPAAGPVAPSLAGAR